ncbi:MAG: cytochrome P450 [Pseudolabrys sp.]
MPMGLTGPRTRNLLYLTGADNVRPVFTDPATFNTVNVPLRSSKGGAQERLRRGLIGAQGAEHAHYRASFLKQTGRAMMTEFSAGVAKHIDGVLTAIPQDQPVNLVTMINDLVRHYAVVTMFKDEDPDFALRIGREITAWLDMAYSAGNVLLPFNIDGLPHAKFRHAGDDIEKKILAWASSRRGMDAKRDILSMFVNGPDETGEPLTQDRLTGHILTIYAASFSSSVAGLIWTLFLLMQHPSIAHDLCDEIEGSKIDPLTDGMKLLELPLLDRVIKESMRLFTPVPYQVRRVAAPAQAGGADLKSRDAVVIGSWATNRLATIYSEPAHFKPERWFDLDASSYDYLTFSAGPRRCVGFGLAQIMVKVSLATMLLKRRPVLAGDMRIDTHVAVTLRSRQPIPTIFGKPGTKIVRKAVSGTAANIYTLPAN